MPVTSVIVYWCGCGNAVTEASINHALNANLPSNVMASHPGVFCEVCKVQKGYAAEMRRDEFTRERSGLEDLKLGLG
jgi:hypothetical protein